MPLEALILVSSPDQAFLEIARHIYDAVGWPGVVFLMAIESACIPFPSEVIMPMAGWLLVDEKGHGFSYLFLGAFFGALGNTIGSVIAYLVGAWGGRPLLEKYGRYVLITRKDIDLADRWFNNYGELIVLGSRVVPVIRTFISLPAGISRMNLPRFTILTFIGSLPFSFALITAGYYLGSNWEDLETYFKPISYPLAAIVVLGVAFFFYHRIREVRREHREHQLANPTSET
jgi:membrane protein DedA with SNARE-associated domain